MKKEHIFYVTMGAISLALVLWIAYESPFWPRNAVAQPGGGMGGIMMEEGMADTATGEAEVDYLEQLNESLMGLKGDALDRAYLTAMIAHHEDAVAMSEEIRGKTKRPELKALADSIISGQAAEIIMMRQWLEDWY